MNFRRITEKNRSIKALFHRVNSSCGRPLVSLMLGLFVLSCTNSTEEFNPMEAYYNESLGLASTTFDSTMNFAHKYNKYVFNTQGAQSDVHYQPTMSNMCNAFQKFGYKLVGWNLDITLVEEDWAGEDDIEIEY